MPLEPLNPIVNRKWRHAGFNLVFMAVTLFIASVFGLAILAMTSWTKRIEFGLLHLIDLSVWLELLLAIMLLDLVAQYSAHWMLHRIKWMWRFHMVHHSDTKVDATTGTRHYPFLHLSVPFSFPSPTFPKCPRQIC